MIQRGFKSNKLDAADINELKDLCRRARGDILAMTTLAGSGHPGGSMSSIEMYITLLSCANIFPANPRNPVRDRIIVSHGHTSPGVYAALARTGFFPVEDVLRGFRKTGSIFEGHVEREVPGVEWGTGNLGQGLSAGCGFALSSIIKDTRHHTFVLMGDGEQQKGQISEARRFAAKYNLNMTVLIDNNHLQISGNIHDIMPQDIKESFKADGWDVIEIDGHDIGQIYEALFTAVHTACTPVAILAKTIMGKGVSFMENLAKYHGVALTEQQYDDAMHELSLTSELDVYKAKRNEPSVKETFALDLSYTDTTGSVREGERIVYGNDDKLDNRSAFGSALKNLGEVNKDRMPVAVFDCDLAGSVKVNGFQTIMPENFFEVGIQEHNAASIAGALSAEGVVAFFADFGVFGVCETYNQHRLNDINNSNVKIVCTHVGLDVGEDGKTHQCIDYIGLFQNLFGFKILTPADPNQTDCLTRYMAATPGNFLMGMGRSKIPVILDETGKPFFDADYRFVYGSIDTIRDGDDAAIISYGGMLHRAVQAYDILKQSGISARVLNVSCPKDLDDDTIRSAAQTGCIITYEDHNSTTGIGSIVANKLFDVNCTAVLRKLGVTSYGMSGPPAELFKAAGLDVNTLVSTVRDSVRNK